MFLSSILLSAPVVSGLPSRLANSAEAEGNPWWLWIVVLIILVAFAAFMLWWWLRRPAEEEEVPHTSARSEHLAPVTSRGEADLPEMTAAPELAPPAEPEPAIVEIEEPRVEDLQIVEGIGPEMAATPELAPPAAPEPAIVETKVPRVDDLQIVEGIGPKIAAVLRDAGVTTFAQLASLDPERLRQILRDRDPNLVRLADPATWPEQARLAAGGEWEALARFQHELKGGRRA